MMTKNRFEEIRNKVEAAKAAKAAKISEQVQPDTFTTRASAKEVIDAARNQK